MNKALAAPSVVFVATYAALAQAPTTFQLKLLAYDDGSTGKIYFQVKRIDVGTRSEFLTRGDVIPGTNYRIANFTYKERRDPATGEAIDVSELQIVHTRTDRKVTLVLAKTIDIPAPDEPAPPSK